MTRHDLEDFRRGAVRMVPVLLGVLPFGLVLGAQAAQKGFGPLGIGLMCGLNFAGGSEFVAVQLWQDPAPLLLIAGVTLLVNCRHILMSAVLTPYLRHAPLPKALAALFFMADETWALGLEEARRQEAETGERRLDLAFYAGLCASLYVAWVASVMVGAAVGPTIGNPRAFGLDMAFTAVFLVLLRGLWKGFGPALPWLASLIAASAVHLTVPGAWYVVAGTAAGLAVAFATARPA